MSTSSYNDDIRAAFSRSIMRSIDGPDNIEKGIQLKVVELASTTAERLIEKLTDENIRWDKQVAQLKSDDVTDDSDPRWVAAERTHALIVKTTENWLETLAKAANK